MNVALHSFGLTFIQIEGMTKWHIGLDLLQFNSDHMQWWPKILEFNNSLSIIIKHTRVDNKL